MDFVHSGGTTTKDQGVPNLTMEDFPTRDKEIR